MSTPVKRELVQPSGNRQRLQLGRQVLLILPPKAPPRTTAEAPEAELELEWVYGYNGRLPKNMHWIPRTGEFLYYTAALGVVMSFDGNSPGAPATQRYFTGHTNEVTCLAYSPEKDLVASGQRDPKGAAKPPVLLWKPGKDTIRFTISHFEYHEKEVAAVCFSSSGDLIFSMGKDDQSMLAVWQTPQWQKPQGLMAFANAQPERRTLPMAQISAGKTPALYMYPVLLENGDPGFVSLNGVSASMREGGWNSIKFWSVRRQATASAASSSSNPSGSKGASGGGGARLKGDNRPAVSAAIRSNVGISLESKQATFGKFPPPRRLLCVATEGDLTLGGSFSGLLYCFQGNMCKGAITLSHSVNGSPKGTTPTPVGLAREPSNLKLSSISAPLPDSPDALGCFFLLGTMTAKLFLIRVKIYWFLPAVTRTWESLLCLKWSHCGRFLAVGCADLNIYLLELVGVWADPNYDRTDINALCSSCRQDRTAPVAPEDLVALGDDMGHVKLLNFPCPSPDTQAKVYKGHASHVQGISFDYKGERVYSGGGRDRCVMAWRLLRKDALPTEEDKFAHLMNAYKEMGGKGQR
uniref:Uncharacterized protein n=1 Tax=Chromera velia CCMP2878 TaxID=1169474 RepID=A0A0G4FV78_9ALVE|eukprot:Cvel_477.t1-p1 / transcript=Cvel_477.t1 / gene=Cvel_477 / organism=Chromera_velia_CCMP2878 / gene_product=Echinoderm microtubule-associated protein-like, putative / transcript_product=Echinoderm microtubule-associated protein-like, putative / location=Cvel_scaffold15:61658-69720(-) / protein_length=579 / sequence_SO=supercontig / SO=protein_coding / is_pseudo=false